MKSTDIYTEQSCYSLACTGNGTGTWTQNTDSCAGIWNKVLVAKRFLTCAERDIVLLIPSVRLYDCPSVTLWYCIETNVHIVKLFPPSDRALASPSTPRVGSPLVGQRLIIVDYHIEYSHPKQAWVSEAYLHCFRRSQGCFRLSWS